MCVWADAMRARMCVGSVCGVVCACLHVLASVCAVLCVVHSCSMALRAERSADSGELRVGGRAPYHGGAMALRRLIKLSYI